MATKRLLESAGRSYTIGGMQRFPFLRFVALGAVVCSSVGFVACATGSSTDTETPGDGGGDGTTDTGGGDTGGGDTGTPTDGGGDTGTTTDGGDSGGGDTGTVAETGDGGDGSTCAAGCPKDKWDIDGDPLTGECGCEYSCVKKGATDPIDDKYTDDNCDGSDGVVEKCVYVSAATGDDTNTGTRVKPVKTIAEAIKKAKAAGVDVCLSGDSYNTTVTMESGVSVYGGFDEKDPTFKFKRSAAATTTIIAADTGVFAPKVDADTHFEGITLSVAPSSSLLAGDSVYGVRFGGGAGKFYVRYNKITVGAGKDGGKGSDGAKGDDGTDGVKGDNGASGSSGTGFGGAGGTSTCGAKGGKGGDGGYGSGSGTDGEATTVLGGKGASSSGCFGGGNNGGPGGTITTPGIPGSAASFSPINLGVFTSAALYTPANGAAGGDGGNGYGGSGGGGGGGGNDVGGFLCNKDRGGGGGGGGAGGCGGKGGKGGLGGGGSFGVTAVGGGTLIVDGCDIKVAKGANGGPGGSGGLAGNAGSGKPGGNKADDAGGGGGGGNGSAGGGGGSGAGGPGGPSVCVAHTTSVTVDFTVGLGKNSCVNGGGGSGGLGASGAANGPAGASTDLQKF